MAEYTILDEYQNCIRLNLDKEPLIVKRCYVLGQYDVTFDGETDLEAVQKMERWAAENTDYRGFEMIAKKLGFYDLFVDQEGRRFLHGFYDGRGRFQFAHDGIEFAAPEREQVADIISDAIVRAGEKEYMESKEKELG